MKTDDFCGGVFVGAASQLRVDVDFVSMRREKVVRFDDGGLKFEKKKVYEIPLFLDRTLIQLSMNIVRRFSISQR